MPFVTEYMFISNRLVFTFTCFIVYVFPCSWQSVILPVVTTVLVADGGVSWNMWYISLLKEHVTSSKSLSYTCSHHKTLVSNAIV